MKATVENLSSLQRKLNVEIPVAVVEGAFQRVYQGLQQEVTIKGFRKGKAPLATIRSVYGDRVKQDVAQDLIQRHYSAALTEHKLEPLSNAEFEFEDPSELGGFNFTATFDIRPEIKLKKFEGLEVEKEIAEFDEKKVDEVITNILSSRATLAPVLEDRAAQLGDTAIVDFDGYVDEKPLEGGKGENHSLELGSNSFIAGFEEGIVGMKAGGQTTLNLKFPTPYHSAELAGKPVKFLVTLKSLQKKVLPELNDEFVATLGGPKTVEELKKSVRDDIQSSETKRIEDAFKNALLKQLVQENPVEVPPSLLKDQKAALIEDFHKRMHDQGLSHKEFEDYVQRWDKDFEKTATEMIQSSFLIDAIARQNDLVCKREDVDKKFAEYSQQTGIEEAKIREFYAKPEQMSRLTYMITEENVIAFLNKSVKVKPVAKSAMKDDGQ